MPFECHDFCWNLSRNDGSSKDLVMIQNDNHRGIVMLATVDGDLTALSTRWNQMYTVVNFWWGNRSYRCIQLCFCTVQCSYVDGCSKLALIKALLDCTLCP